MTTQIVYSSEFNRHDNIGHPENAERLLVMMKAVTHAPFYDKLSFIEPTKISEELLFSVHSEEMIQQIKDSSDQGNSWIDLDTYVCKNDYTTARLAAGGVVDACQNVISGKADNAFAMVRPPGHHATLNRSMGFCLFNNAALAAQHISNQGKRVLIFDHDVHHGNGTQSIFYERSDVLYQSFHLSPHYPGTGAINEIGQGSGKGYTVNAPLSHGAGDDVVSCLLDEIFLPIARQFKPDIIIVSSGFDSHHADHLGGLALTADFFGEMIKRYQEIQPKLVCTLEGGYNLDWIGKCLLSQLGQLTSHPVVFGEKTSENTTGEQIVFLLKKELKGFWKL